MYNKFASGINGHVIRVAMSWAFRSKCWNLFNDYRRKNSDVDIIILLWILIPSATNCLSLIWFLLMRYRGSVLLLRSDASAIPLTKDSAAFQWKLHWEAAPPWDNLVATMFYRRSYTGVLICQSAVATPIQYIPRNMHTVLLCFALLWLCNRS